mgnify:CR=1 FL=1
MKDFKTQLEADAFDFAQRVSKLSKRESFKECTILRKELRTKYSDATMRNYLTQYRKACKELELSLDSRLRVSKTQQRKVQSKTNKSVVDQNRTTRFIVEYKKLIEISKEMLTSEKKHDIAIGLMILTGRRPSEIMKSASFKLHKRRVKELIFEGQLKTKENPQDLEPYKIYALGNSAKLCIKALAKLRELTISDSELSIPAITRKYNSSLNIKLPRIVGSYFEDTPTCKDLRKAYAAICVHLYQEDSEGMKNAFLCDLLGHGKDDIQTANSYSKYYIK